MTAEEIKLLQPGDSIVGAFGLDDELLVTRVEHSQVFVRYSASTVVSVPLIPGGPEIRGAQV